MFEDEIWKQLQKVSPEELVINARAEYNEITKEISLKVFNEKITVNAAKKTITGKEKLSPLLPLFILHYLACSKDMPLSGKLLSPEQLRGGIFFFRGAHELPLKRITAKFEKDTAGFIKKGEKLGGEKICYGDAAVKLWLLPRVPVIFILWKKDEEFESRINILLDKSAEEQMNLDILFLGLLYATGKMAED